MTKMADWTPEQRNRLAAMIKADLEAPLPDPEFIEITETAAPGTKGRQITVHLPDGSTNTWAVKTGTCAMYGRWTDTYGDDHWSPITRMFKTVDGLMNSNWRAESEANARKFVEFRMAKIAG